jgi:uncharacterized repeat protein (TIGR01451 family)
MKKVIYSIGLSILAVALLGSVSKALADCQPLYGGGSTCPNFAFTITKMVEVPGTNGQFVNNLDINSAKYSPSQSFLYEINVTNTGANTIPTITITDTFPQYISFVSGVGNFNSGNNTLTFTVSNINPGQTLTYNITAKTAASNALPSNQGVICNIVNTVSAVDSNGDTGSSSSSLCIQQPVLGATPAPAPSVLPAPKIVTTPPTGPEMLPLLALLPGALGGFVLRKKSNKLSHLKGGEK